MSECEYACEYIIKGSLNESDESITKLIIISDTTTSCMHRFNNVINFYVSTGSRYAFHATMSKHSGAEKNERVREREKERQKRWKEL
jgi:predicted phosphohydrolase